MNGKTLILLSLILLLISGCNATKQDVGTVIGAGTGAFVGSQIGGGTGQLAAVALGALLGGYLGGSIGQQMDELDRYKTQQVLESSPTGATSSWNNPDTGVAYNVTPTYTYESASGPCRDYTTEAVIEGRAEVVHGTACRQPDGTWHAMN
ncbi:MAG: glycine zipper 2TM domain-containing protein [Gammaproteobacteria bacterium]|nr:glycine zipper 2TM domain-containing protein [Gammaproteobacteria bacterium]